MRPDAPTPVPPTGRHLCPWWAAYLLASPLRRLSEDPDRLLGPHLEEGMTVLDVGAALGFFSLPAARRVGPNGRVICLDVQERMLRSLEGRARRKGLGPIVETRLCTQEDLGVEDLAERVDRVLLLHVLHETVHPRRVLRDCHATLRPGGRMILTEARGHVSDELYAHLVELALEAGFERREEKEMRRSRGVLLQKPRASA